MNLKVIVKLKQAKGPELLSLRIAELIMIVHHNYANITYLWQLSPEIARNNVKIMASFMLNSSSHRCINISEL